MGTPVEVEILRLGVAVDGLRWAGLRRTLPDGAAPDRVAQALAGVEDGAPAGVALHSTSWRLEAGAVVLTYALFPAAPEPGWEPLHEHVAAGQGPLEPTPDVLAPGHVAAHAARHLADLAGGRDPHLTACARLLPASWEALQAAARGVHTHATRAPAPPATAAVGPAAP